MPNAWPASMVGKRVLHCASGVWGIVDHIAARDDLGKGARAVVFDSGHSFLPGKELDWLELSPGRLKTVLDFTEALNFASVEALRTYMSASELGVEKRDEFASLLAALLRAHAHMLEHGGAYGSAPNG